VFVVPDKRRRDLDNAMASLKAGFDALVAAGLLVDDDSEHLKHAAPEMRVEQGQKYVEVTLT
jgi:Holliday junction resolvase RusA-like endonuclease